MTVRLRLRSLILVVTSVVATTVAIVDAPAQAATYSYNLAAEPEALVATDLDGDQDDDIVVGSRSGLIQTWRNDGTGRLTRVQSSNPFGTYSSLTDLASGDLNGDGRGDVVVGLAGIPGIVSVQLSRGDGTLQPPQTYNVCTTVSGVTVGDINGDRVPDVAATSNCFTAAPLYNDGKGGLTPGGSYGNGYVSVRIVVSDLDGDDDADIAYANVSGNITVLRNTGGGSFAPYVWYHGGDGPHDLAALDYDTDGDKDLAVANSYGNNVGLLRNRGDATFEPTVYVPTGDYPLSIGAADLDGDGDLDLATANHDSNNVSILRNDDGSFAEVRRLSASTGPYDLVLANLDAGNQPDLAVVAFGSTKLTIRTDPGTS